MVIFHHAAVYINHLHKACKNKENCSVLPSTHIQHYTSLIQKNCSHENTRFLNECILFSISRITSASN